MRLLTRRRAAVALAAAVGLGVAGWWFFSNRSNPVPETPIFTGVVYGCKVLPRTPGGGGPVHWVRVDLTAPGVGLYVTPTDPSAGPDYQYRLRWTGVVARSEHLAVAVNACLFTREVPWAYWPGMRANGVETAVSDGRASHVWEHTYLAWFERDLTPHLERTKPPSPDVLGRTRWGVGGQGVGLLDGVVRGGAADNPDARTAVGIDPDRRLLFLAVFESASERRALEELAALGARDGMLLDGGGSTAMAVGVGAAHVRPGVVLGGRRPVATHFGVRATPLAAE